jgi:hypothetical protein
MTISRSSRPNTADLQPQVPPLSSSPRFKHELFKHVDNPVVELNEIPRAPAPGDVVHKHSTCGALTSHRGATSNTRRPVATRPTTRGLRRKSAIPFSPSRRLVSSSANSTTSSQLEYDGGGRVKLTYQLKRDLQWWTQVPSANNGRSIFSPIEIVKPSTR